MKKYMIMVNNSVYKSRVKDSERKIYENIKTILHIQKLKKKQITYFKKKSTNIIRKNI